MDKVVLGVVIGKRSAFDETSPPGLDTAINAVPGATTRLAGTVAVSLVALTKLVTKGVWLAPFPQFTTAPGAKPAPLTVSVKPPLPGTDATGEMLLMKGTGFCARPASAKASNNIAPIATMRIRPKPGFLVVSDRGCPIFIFLRAAALDRRQARPCVANSLAGEPALTGQSSEPG